jgi:hypothetical protein
MSNNYSKKFRCGRSAQRNIRGGLLAAVAMAPPLKTQRPRSCQTQPLLRPLRHQRGTLPSSRATILTKTTYIQRLNTNGGSAPASGCSGPPNGGKQTLVPYSADYYFFRAGR